MSGNNGTFNEDVDAILDGVPHCLLPEYRDDFPCNANAIKAVSLGIATAGVCLMFVRFYLLKQVSSISSMRNPSEGVMRVWLLSLFFGSSSSNGRPVRVCDMKWNGQPEVYPLKQTIISNHCALLACQNKKQVAKAERGNELMNKISEKIKSGARAFLKTEYKYLSIYAAVVFCVLLVLYTVDPPSNDKTDGIRYASCFLCGALLSGGAGWAGMAVATDCNVRTTQAADKQGLAVALRVAFTGGAVMGFTVVGLGLLGLCLMLFLVTLGYDDEPLNVRLVYASDVMSGFAFGASSIAIFARVAGGIYTKAADVGADLVGKVEMDIPEDDPRNPAVIADNVGDNVGDVAGMGADLFESYVSTKCCAILSVYCVSSY